MGIPDDPAKREFRAEFSGPLILPDWQKGKKYRWPRVPEEVRTGKALKGRRIILVQASDGRLGMYVMGQALFSRLLMEKWCRSHEVQPKSMKSVIACTARDSELEPFLKRYALELFVAKSGSKPRGRVPHRAFGI